MNEGKVGAYWYS